MDELKIILQLVQLGLGGIVAVMAVLSYQLMKYEIKRPNRNLNIFEHIHRYAKYTTYLSIIVIAGALTDGLISYGTKLIDSKVSNDKRKVVTLSRQAQDCRESLFTLIGEETNDRSVSDLNQIQRLVHQSCFRVMRSIEDLEG